VLLTSERPILKALLHGCAARSRFLLRGLAAPILHFAFVESHAAGALDRRRRPDDRLREAHRFDGGVSER